MCHSRHQLVAIQRLSLGKIMGRHPPSQAVQHVTHKAIHSKTRRRRSCARESSFAFLYESCKAASSCCFHYVTCTRLLNAWRAKLAIQVSSRFHCLVSSLSKVCSLLAFSVFPMIWHDETKYLYSLARATLVVECE